VQYWPEPQEPSSSPVQGTHPPLLLSQLPVEQAEFWVQLPPSVTMGWQLPSSEQ
jgi:hypothetical protein